jgi:hypothetical protein
LGLLLLGLHATCQHVERIEAEDEPQDAEDDDGADPDATTTAAHGYANAASSHATLATPVFDIGTGSLVIKAHGLPPGNSTYYSGKFTLQWRRDCNH